MITGCSSKCKESGCDQDATKDGYCDIHYAAHAISDAIGVVCHAKRKKMTSKLQKIAAETIRIGGLIICLNGFIEPFFRELPRKKRQISTKISAPVEKQLMICEICTNLCVLLNLSEISLKSHFYTDKIRFN